MLRLLTSLVALVLVGGTQRADQFITVKNVRLHYLDWGGHGPVLLFLTSFDSSAHEFDQFAPKFADRLQAAFPGYANTDTAVGFFT